MKNMKKIFVLIILFSGIVASSFAQITKTASAAANIITPITLTKTLDMSFGNIAVNPTAPGGTVTLPAASTATRTITGGITLPTVNGLVQAAKFTVNGEGTSAYSIAIPGTITITSSSNTMTIVPLSNPSGSGALVGGTQDIYVGGTLTVGASQAVGSYTGTFNLTVNYN
jgi:hypothetical protein